ncbi:hypothetical protein Hte_007930 [Hypoxylon texense]
MANKKNTHAKLALFPKSPTAPDNSHGGLVTNTPVRRSVASYVDTLLSPQSAAEYKSLLYRPIPEIPGNEVASGPSATGLLQGELEIDGQRRTSILASALVSPLKLKTWPSEAQRDNASSGLASSRSESWGVRFISDTNDDGSVDNASGQLSPGVLLNVSPRIGRKRRVDTSKESKDSMDTDAVRAAVQDAVRDTEGAGPSQNVGKLPAEKLPAERPADERPLAEADQIAEHNIKEVQDTKPSMLLPLRLCEQHLSSLPYPPPSGPPPPVPQPRPIPSLIDRIATSNSNPSLPRARHLRRASQTINSSRRIAKGKGIAYPTRVYETRTTSNTNQSGKLTTLGSSSATRTVSFQTLPTRPGARQHAIGESSSACTSANKETTPKKTKLLPFFEHTDSETEETPPGSPLNLLEEPPHILDLPLKTVQAGPKKPTIVHPTLVHEPQQAVLVDPETELLPQQAVIVEPEIMTTSRGSPTPPHRARQSLRENRVLQAPACRVTGNPRQEYLIQEEAAESSRAMATRPTEARSAEPEENSISSVLGATAMLREMLGDDASELGDASPVASTRAGDGDRIITDAQSSRLALVPMPLEIRPGQPLGEGLLAGPIRPTSVVAASTPTRLFTHEFIRGMIHEEMVRHQSVTSPDRINQQRALAALSLESGPASLRSEAALRTFTRQQVALHAPEVLAY